MYCTISKIVFGIGKFEASVCAQGTVKTYANSNMSELASRLVKKN